MIKTKPRTLYDCFNAKVKGNFISCSKGHPFSRKGKLDIFILNLARGKPLSLAYCQSCQDFENMEGDQIKPECRGWLGKLEG